MTTPLIETNIQTGQSQTTTFLCFSNFSLKANQIASNIKGDMTAAKIIWGIKTAK
jgi:hypothetical protein